MTFKWEEEERRRRREGGWTCDAFLITKRKTIYSPYGYRQIMVEYIVKLYTIY